MRYLPLVNKDYVKYFNYSLNVLTLVTRQMCITNVGGRDSLVGILKTGAACPEGTTHIVPYPGIATIGTYEFLKVINNNSYYRYNAGEHRWVPVDNLSLCKVVMQGREVRSVC